jgi:hypothetical protein
VTTTTPFGHTVHWVTNRPPFLKSKQLDTMGKLSTKLGTPRGEGQYLEFSSKPEVLRVFYGPFHIRHQSRGLVAEHMIVDFRMMFHGVCEHVGDNDLVGVTGRYKITIYSEIPAAKTFHLQILS